MKVEKKNKPNNKELNKNNDKKSIKHDKTAQKQDKVVKNLKNSNPKVLKTEAKQEKKAKKQKKNTEETNGNEDSPKETVELDEAQKAKAEKKKAKKLAKKLKKEENKEKQVDAKANQKKGTSLTDQKKKSLDQNGKGDHPSRDPEVEAATVFVGNLPTTTKRVQIVKLFAKVGTVKSIRLRTAAGQVIFKHKQRKQAGSLNAYVVLNSAEAAQKALELNGQEFKGNHLRVTPSDPEKNRKEHDTKRTIFVGNLKWSANEEKLREIFSNCGEVDYIRCLYDGQSKCKGVAYVCFKAPEAVGLAMELNETLLDERPIHVERYTPRKLGAKAARDKQANANNKGNPKKSGASKRIDNKNKQKNTNGEPNEAKKEKKKSEFRGVKVTANKKKNKKKITNEMKSIAKKIAPNKEA